MKSEYTIDSLKYDWQKEFIKKIENPIDENENNLSLLTVYYIWGGPRTGKTYFGNVLEQNFNAFHIKDLNIFDNQIWRLEKEKLLFVFANENITSDMVSKLISNFPDLGKVIRRRVSNTT